MLAAIDRYVDKRIDDVQSAAATLGAQFMILSGEYGLLNPSDPIPYYDHLLISEEIAEHASLVSQQLVDTGVHQITFFSVPAAADPYIEPYLACITNACTKAGVDIAVVYLPASYA